VHRKRSSVSHRLLPAASAALAVVTSLCPLNSARAYRTFAEAEELAPTVRLRWEREVHVQLASPAPPGLTDAEIDSAIAHALESWSEAGCATPTFRYLGRGADGPMSGDGIVSIAFVRSRWTAAGYERDAAATTEVLYTVSSSGAEGEVLDADILLNAENFTWRGGVGDAGARALGPVLHHELGHALGLLAHPCELAGAAGAPDCATLPEAANATMFPLYSPDVQDAVRQDDREGLCFLYGERGPACVEPCSADDVCQSGACVPSDCAAVGACEPCVGDSECAGYCDRFCRELKAPGLPCAAGSECETGVCSRDVCASVCTAGECESSRYCTPEGACRLSPTDFGADCAAPTDCESSLCLTGTRDGNFCTVSCSSGPPVVGECPERFRCAVVDGRDVCVPPAAAPSCSATHVRVAPTLIWLGLLALLAFRLVLPRSRAALGAHLSSRFS